MVDLISGPCLHISILYYIGCNRHRVDSSSSASLHLTVKIKLDGISK